MSTEYDWGQDGIRSQPSTAETKGFSPITTEINHISGEGSDDVDQNAGKGPRYITTLPTTTQHEKKSVEDIPLNKLSTSRRERPRTT